MDRRSQVLSFVQRYVQENGYAPTCEEIREAVGLSSKSHAAYYLEALKEEGLVERRAHAPRGLRLVDLAPDELEVSVAGRPGSRTGCKGRKP
jgi:SOS-response transcriptional repressor LexA